MIETILNTLLFFIAIFCGLVAILIGSGVITLFFTRVPFVPTPKKNVKSIIDQFNLKPGQVFYDLGCGEGRFLIEAEKRGAKATGFEIAPWAYLRGRTNLMLHRSKAKINFKNFYQQNISDADAIFGYLMDTVMPKVEQKLESELKPGCKVICKGFKLPNWIPDKIINLQPKNKHARNIYIYLK